MSFESFMDLRNIKVTFSSELFPAEVLDKAIEKSFMLATAAAAATLQEPRRVFVRIVLLVLLLDVVVVILQVFFLVLSPGEGGKVLNVPRLSHSRRWEVFLVGIGMPGS